MMAKRYRVSFWSGENIIKLIMALVAQICDVLEAIKLYRLNG